MPRPFIAAYAPPMRVRLPYSIRSPLRLRLSLTVAVLVLGATLLVGPLALHVAERDMREVVGDQQFAVLSSAAAFMDDRLDARLRRMDALANAVPPEVRAAPARLQAWLGAHAGSQDEFVNIVGFARNGELIASSSPMPGAQPITVAGRAWFEDTLRRGRGLVSDPLTGRLTGAQIVLVSAPVFGPRGDIVFVLAGRIDLRHSQFLRQIDALKPGKTGYLFLTSASGVLIDHPARERLLERIDARPGPPPGIERALHGFEGWVHGSDSAGPAIFAYKRLRTTGWILGARYPSKEAFAPIDRVSRNVLAVAAALALLAGVLGGWIARRQLAPLDQLRRGIAAIRAGADIGVLQVSRRDEIGELGRAFHGLVQERGRATAQLRAIADNVPALIAYVGRGERFEFTNAAFDRRLGIAPGAALGRPLDEVLGKTALARLAPLIEAARRGEPGRAEYADKTDEGDGRAPRHLMIETIPDLDAMGAVAGYYVLALDISERKETELRLEQMARLDALTGIANRRLFGETLTHAMGRARRQRSVLGLAYLDIDHFKQINDTWGHGVGDEVLKEFARRLAGSVRASDSAARLAGDEFVIVLEDVKGAAEAARVGEKVVEAMRQPFATSAGEIRLTTSIGIVLADGAASLADQDQLLGRADSALYDAKHGGRDRCVVRG
jgi:diguanylate cyclase (GGDEF)-like protein/PAS domain S-box-containing protein